MKDIITIVFAVLLMVLVVGLAYHIVKNPVCVDRQPFVIGNDSLGMKGTYCAKWGPRE